MQEEAKRQISDRLDEARRELLEAQRIAKTDPNVSKHLLRALRDMAGQCEYQQARL